MFSTILVPDPPAAPIVIDVCDVNCVHFVKFEVLMEIRLKDSRNAESECPPMLRDEMRTARTLGLDGPARSLMLSTGKTILTFGISPLRSNREYSLTQHKFHLDITAGAAANSPEAHE
jgi:hypothetical protein